MKGNQEALMEDITLYFEKEVFPWSRGIWKVQKGALGSGEQPALGAGHRISGR